MSMYAQEVRAFARSVSLRLLTWSALSMACGALLWWRGRPFWRAFGVQALVWGAIDALIAGFGLLGQRRAQAGGTAAGGAGEAVEASVDAVNAVTDTTGDAGLDAALHEARKLRRLLGFNALLDVGYVGGGVALVRTKGRSDPRWRGHGWGIIVQGTFLLVFDLYHALAISPLPSQPHGEE